MGKSTQEKTQKPQKVRSSNDITDSIIGHMFKRERQEIKVPEGAKEKLMQKIAEIQQQKVGIPLPEQAEPGIQLPEQTIPTKAWASHNIRDVGDHKLMEGTMQNSKEATEFIQEARSNGVDAIAVSAPGVVLMSGDSKVMQQALSQFSMQRQDISLDDGSTVACITPQPGQSLQALAQDAVARYEHQVALELHEQSMAQALRMAEQNGITEKAGVTIAKAHGLSLSEAATMVEAVSAGHHNTIVSHANGDKMDVVVPKDSSLGQALISRHSDKLSESPNSNVAVFTFDSKQEALQFVNEANSIGVALDAQERDNAMEDVSIDD